MRKNGNGAGAPLRKLSRASAAGQSEPNWLYFGDNLDWLTKLDSATVDLVYLDPPFNSKAQYNILYETPDNLRGTAQASVFRDSWSWEDEATRCFDEILAHVRAHKEPTSAAANGSRRL
jgi:16S rRNA G966 N2-methylase RsmD